MPLFQPVASKIEGKRPQTCHAYSAFGPAPVGLGGWFRMASGEELRQLTDWGLCVLLWSHDVLDPHEKFRNFKRALKSEIVDRGLSESDVWKSQQGFLEWKRTNG